MPSRSAPSSVRWLAGASAGAILSAALWAAPAVRAEDPPAPTPAGPAAKQPAPWCKLVQNLPQDTEQFVRVGSMRAWYAILERSETGRAMLADMDNAPQVRVFAGLLGMPPAALRERYLSGTLLWAKVPDAGAVLFTEVKPADRDLAIAKLGLAPIGQSGGYILYQTADEASCIAFGRGVMVLGGSLPHERLSQWLAGDGQHLPADAGFAKLAAALPPADIQPDLMFWDRAGAGSHLCTGHLTKGAQGETLQLDYAGPHPAGLNPAPAGAPAPLATPADAWATLQCQGLPSWMAKEEKFDEMMAPDSWTRDIAPSVGPVTLMLCPPAADRPVPRLAMGMGFNSEAKRDRARAAVERVMAKLDDDTRQADLPPPVRRSTSHAGVPYQVLQFSATPAEGGEVPAENLDPRLAWGATGRHLLLSNEEGLFTRMLDLQAAPKEAAKPLPTAPPQARNLLIAFRVNTHACAASMQLMGMLMPQKAGRARPPAIEEADDSKPGSLASLADLGRWLGAFESLEGAFGTGRDDASILVGHGVLNLPPAPPAPVAPAPPAKP